MPKSSPSAPYLDHVSLLGGQAVFEELGFRVVPTDGHQHHCRVYLEGTYLEVVPPENETKEVATRGWFLRPEDLQQTADSLRAAGLTVDGPSRYVGEDGTWLDLEISGRRDGALPVLTHRTDRASADWPPREIDPHPNGARRLLRLRIRMKDPDRLLGMLAILGSHSVGSSAVTLPGGEEVVLEVATQRPDGIVELAFERAAGPPILLAARPVGE